MSIEELYKPHIQKAANAYAYSEALDMELEILMCPGFEGGMRILCEELLKDGVVDPQRLLHWLEAKTKVKPDKMNWWVSDKDEEDKNN